MEDREKMELGDEVEGHKLEDAGRNIEGDDDVEGHRFEEAGRFEEGHGRAEEGL